MSQKPYPQILADCVEAVLSGQQTIDDCLRQYPEHAALLKLDLQAAILVTRLSTPRLSEEKVKVLELRLRRQRHRRRRRVPLRIAAGIILTLLLVLGSGGAVYASSDSLPGDTLYLVKRLWENVIVIIARVTDQLDTVWLQLAQTRLAEVLQTAVRGHLTQDMLLDLRFATSQAIVFATSDTESGLVLHIIQLEEAIVSGKLQVLGSKVDDTILSTIRPLLPLASPTVEIIVMTLTPTQPPAQIVTNRPTLEPPTATSTPRIPATTTRTPTPPPIPELSVSPSHTPTITQTPTTTNTPLPSPTLPGIQVKTPTIVPRRTNASPPVQVSPTWYPWPRLTQDTLYATRTAEAQEQG